MPKTWNRSKLFLWLAVLFVLADAAYSCIWAYYIRSLPQSRIGVVFRPFQPGVERLTIISVSPASPAERAGLMTGDSIEAINGRPLKTIDPWVEYVAKARPNSAVVFTIRQAAGDRFERVVTTQDLPPELLHPTLAQTAIMNSLMSYPLFFLAVIALVLFYRYEDRNAWLLAILFSGFIALAPWVNPETEPLVPLAIRRLTLPYQFVFKDLLPAFFYCFFAVFPVPSPLDRKVPWLKFAMIGTVAMAELPFLWAVVSTGSGSPVIEAGALLKEPFDLNRILAGYTIGAFVLGLVSLASNSFSAQSGEAKRKTRILAFGTLAGIVPLLAMTFYVSEPGHDASPVSLPFYAWVVGVASLVLVPLSFAYAVVKHRVMEIPVLLKRSARYLLIRRGFAFVIFAMSTGVAWISVWLFGHWLPLAASPSHSAVVAVGMAGAGVGGLMAAASASVQHRVRERLDRAFFRSQNDARQMLEVLAERIRTANNFAELASLLKAQVAEALQPTVLALYFEGAEGQLEVCGDDVPDSLRVLPADLPRLREAARRARPMSVLPSHSSRGDADWALERLHSECLVPLLARDGSLVGAMILGPKRSEEPYSGEDKRLLASVANQAGVAAEALRLAEKMARQLEAERRTAFERETAQQVQARLLPQHAPRLQTLDYVGTCVQARAVGGDYYDFLDVGDGKVALVLGDVSGKGMPAALLMASLQAAIRTQCAAGLGDLAAALRQMNHLLYVSTAAQHFATMFFAEYDDMHRRLRYANCGHNPPILLRSDGRIQRLEPTATVLGIFPEWQRIVEETLLDEGDLLVAFTNGVIEAANQEGEEFGDERLIDALRSHRSQSTREIADCVAQRALEFGGQDQADDLTMIIGRVVEGAPCRRDPFEPDNDEGMDQGCSHGNRAPVPFTF
jgi:sigma-B regulation protein RsbU (phosphoserine phosphatase)